jgi:hypothetical protein
MLSLCYGQLIELSIFNTFATFAIFAIFAIFALVVVDRDGYTCAPWAPT